MKTGFRIARAPLVREVNDWVDASGGVPPDYDYLYAVSNFVQDLRGSGWWDVLTGIAMLSAPRNGALVDLRAPSTVYVQHGIMNYVPLDGAQSDTASGYLDTGYLGTNLPGFDHATGAGLIGVWSQTDIPTAIGDIGATSGGGLIGMRTRAGASCQFWMGQTTPITMRSPIGTGLHIACRTDAAQGWYAKDDQTSSWLSDFAGMPTGPFSLFRLGLTSGFSLNKLALALWGNATATPDMAPALWNAHRRLLQSFNDFIIPPDPESVGPQTFAPSSSAAVTPSGWKVFRFPSNPPVSDDDPDFVNFPCTDVAARPWGWSTTQTLVSFWESLWIDRANLEPASTAKIGNDTMIQFQTTAGLNCRVNASSYDAAICMTVGKAAYSAGYLPRNDPDDPAGEGWLDKINRLNPALDTSIWDALPPDDPAWTQDAAVYTGAVMHRAWAYQNRDGIFVNNGPGNYKTANDIIILGTGRLVDVPVNNPGCPIGGFFCDAEPDDSRGGALWEKTVNELKTITRVKGLKILLSMDPLYKSGKLLGMTQTNANRIAQRVDYVNLVIDGAPPGGEELAAILIQENVYTGADFSLTPPFAHFLMQLPIGPHGGETALAYIQAARARAIAMGYAGVIIVPGFATLGGDLSRTPNQSIATFTGLPTT